jgi:tRNA1(Val) A37 N6-methylase TrmN6
MEMCSGPGFMGFYLNNINLCKNLYLVDINEENKNNILTTINKNNLNNISYIQSNCFDNVTEKLENNLDMIISNPPHFKTQRVGGYKSDVQKLISLDENMIFHKKFFKQSIKFLKDDGIIILVENCDGVTESDIRNITKNDFSVLFVEYDKYGWKGESNFYTIILQKNINNK